MAVSISIWWIVGGIGAVVLFFSGWKIKGFSMDNSGPHFEFAKSDAKGRERVRLLDQALELQKDITILEEKEMLLRHMMIAEEEIGLVRGILSGKYQELMIERGIKEDDVVTHEDYHFYQLLWDKLENKLLDKLKDSFIYNGFHTMEPNTSEFLEYTGNKFEILWLMCKGYWDKNYRSSSTVHRCDVKSISKESEQFLKDTLRRIYIKAQDTEKRVNEEVDQKKELLKNLQNDLMTLGANNARYLFNR